MAPKKPKIRILLVDDHSIVLLGLEAVFRSFDHTAGGLRCVDVDKLEGFAICGEDGKWVWAEARWAPGAAPRRKIILKSPDVPQPVGIRYAWADNPRCNIISTEGLPLTPFRVEPPAKATVNK